jgi:hypothetical protein
MSRPSRVAAVLLAGTILGVPPAAAAQPVIDTARNPAIEVVICGPHYRALFHWLRAAREGVLPESGLQVVHIDAHPDLAVPAAPVRADAARDPERLLRGIDIASFQLAGAHIGLVERVVWVRSDFANQLADGERSFLLGTVGSGLLRVDDPSDYYVLDDGWAPRQRLRRPVPVRLRVLPLSAAANAPSLAEGRTVLDIDLDAFATRNPAADRLREMGLPNEDLDRLRTIFAREKLVLAEDPETRIAQFDGLLAAVQTLAEGSWTGMPTAFVTLWHRGIGPRDLLALYRMLGRISVAMPVEGLLEQGRQLVGVPEHTQVDRAEIERSAAHIRAMLRNGAVEPALVTIARSVQDGFTPEESWPAIEGAVLRALEDGLGNLRVRYDQSLRPAPAPAPPISSLSSGSGSAHPR